MHDLWTYKARSPASTNSGFSSLAKVPPCSSEVVVRFMSYNAQFDLLTMTEVYFFFAESGRIWKQILHSSLILTPYKDAMQAVCDGIFLLLKLWILIAEVFQFLFPQWGMPLD